MKDQSPSTFLLKYKGMIEKDQNEQSKRQLKSFFSKIKFTNGPKCLIKNNKDQNISFKNYINDQNLNHINFKLSSQAQTPNLDFIKAQRAEKKNYKMPYCPIEEQDQKNYNLQTINQKIGLIQNTGCYSHPHKRAKYFIESNPTKRFCTKCAINIAEKEEVYDDQSKEKQLEYSKKKEIGRFMEKIESMKQFCKECYTILTEEVTEIQDRYQNQIGKLNQIFFIVQQKIKQQKQIYQNTIYNRLCQSIKTLESIIVFVKSTDQSFDKYLNDVRNNYQGIIKDISTQCFNQIMPIYFTKISQYEEKLIAVKARPKDYLSVKLLTHNIEDDINQLLSKITVANIKQSIVVQYPNQNQIHSRHSSNNSSSTNNSKLNEKTEKKYKEKMTKGMKTGEFDERKENSKNLMQQQEKKGVKNIKKGIAKTPDRTQRSIRLLSKKI